MKSDGTKPLFLLHIEKSDVSKNWFSEHCVHQTIVLLYMEKSDVVKDRFGAHCVLQTIVFIAYGKLRCLQIQVW